MAVARRLAGRGGLARFPVVTASSTSAALFSTSIDNQASSAPPPALDKLLVANRGEIACRIFTTARRLGIPTVAVFSEADRSAAHVALADEALCIGTAAARDSYLRYDRILDAAKLTAADAVHPGYGFLSENASFAAACASAGIAFVGPPAAAIDAMGDKSRAKATMAAASVPVVPGYHGEEQNEDFLKEQAEKAVGYPLLVKAVMGGGGKGMKLARNSSEFMDALHSAKREAAASFGDDRVLLERFIEAPRHVEVQVLADTHGNAFYLAERDCSVQRRHQKVIEEAPAPGVDRAFRAKIGGSAVDAARAVGYCNAGTVEFILDSKTGDYYFMEMNTRLQVEHPVTEAVVGLDLVELQLRVAAGESLDGILSQDALEPHGHAFEARLYAENPHNNFLPAGGKVLRWRPPPGAVFFSFSSSSPDSSSSMSPSSTAGGAASPRASLDSCVVRVDSGVREGDVVGVNYDPMIAKVVVKGPNRATALSSLRDALGALQVSGLPTNAEFVRRVAVNEEFQSGAVDTSFISRHEGELLAPQKLESGVKALAAAAFVAIDAAASSSAAAASQSPAADLGPWNLHDSFRLNHTHQIGVNFTHTGSNEQIELAVMPQPLTAASSAAAGSISSCYFISSSSSSSGDAPDDTKYEVKELQLGRDWLMAEVDGKLCRASWNVYTHGEEEILDVWMSGGTEDPHHQFRRPVVRKWRASGSATTSAGTVASPMPGKIVKVFVSKGQSVQEGERICVVEAMKMEHAVKASCGGVVEELHAFEGAQVEDGQVLAVVRAAKVEEQAAAGAE